MGCLNKRHIMNLTSWICFSCKIRTRFLLHSK